MKILMNTSKNLAALVAVFALHLGVARAGRYLRKFYPWYLERLNASKAQQAAFQQTASLDDARALLAAFVAEPAAA